MKTYLLALIFIGNITYSQNKNSVNEFYKRIVANVENKKIFNEFIRQDMLELQERFELFSLQLDDIKEKTASKKCTIYSYREAVNKKKIDYKFINEDQDNIYFLYFNKNLIFPILTDKEGKIIAISTMNKGQIKVFLLI